MIISTIVVVSYRVVVVVVVQEVKLVVNPQKIKMKLKKSVKDVLQCLANALKRLAGKAAVALPGIIGSVIGAVLNYLLKAIGFFAKNTWPVIVFITGIIGYWIYDKVAVS